MSGSFFDCHVKTILAFHLQLLSFLELDQCEAVVARSSVLVLGLALWGPIWLIILGLFPCGSRLLLSSIICVLLVLAITTDRNW